MCNANCINTHEIDKNIPGRIILCNFISSNHEDILTTKKWNYSILYIHTVHIQTCKCVCLCVRTCTYVTCILPVYGMCMACLCIPFNISVAGVLCMNTCTHIYTVPSLYYWQLGLQWSP